MTLSTNLPPWPVIEEDEIEAAAQVLRSGKINYWTGEEGRKFEEEYAAYTNTKYAICIANGTLTLELALRAIGVGHGDEVIVPPRTFVGTASAVMMCGAKPVFCDVDRVSGNITAQTIAQVLTPRTKAVIPVHMAGWPCDMDPIMALASEHHFIVIEDCAQAHGARYKNRAVGSLGHIGSFSFCQDKILTTGGEGGLITTNDEALWQRMWSLKDHGKSYDTVYHKQHPPGFRWLHESVGTNARMTEMQSAIGRIALRKLDGRVNDRRKNAAVYDSMLSRMNSIELLSPPKDFYHSYYRYYINIKSEELKPDWSRERILAIAAKRGLPSSVGTCCEIYLEKVFASHGLSPAAPFPNARYLSDHAIMLPVYSTLGEQHVSSIAEGLLEIINDATK